MSKKEKSIAEFYQRMQRIGIDFDDAYALRRIEMTLHRWAEEECNGTIQRDGENGDGKPRRYWETALGEIVKGSIIPDREKGALKRLDAIMRKYPGLHAYNQTDPRGCALYIVRDYDLFDKYTGKDLDISSAYTRGVAVCY